MQSLRSSLRHLPVRSSKIIKKPSTSSLHTFPRTMSLFPRFTNEFSPLFRLLDDYDRATRTFPSNTQVRSFAPKFDVREIKDAYELHGELPGIDQKDVSIEWSDGNTLTISGRTEHRHEESSGIDEDHHAKQPTVEDEAGQADSSAVTRVAQSGEIQKASDAHVPKYWVSERSVGEFHRSFSFPARVDQDAVKASLKNGILSVVVPKAAAPKPRRINID